MRAKLIVTGGKANKREVEVELPATIGRSRDADLTVGHRMISRKHCEAYLVDGLMMIRDIGSLNGTYVRGRRIREAPLPPGEKFTIGPITFRVNYEYSGDRSNLPPLVPAEPVPLADTPDAREALAESSQSATEPGKDEEVYAVASQSEEAESKTPPASANAEEEPDFEVLDEDDFELAAEEPRQEDSKQESPKVEEPPQEDPKQESPKVKEPPQEDSKQESPKVKEPPQEDPKQESPKVKKPPQEDSKQKSPEPKKKEAEPEKDPEEQLLDDFLNDIQ